MKQSEVIDDDIQERLAEELRQVADQIESGEGYFEKIGADIDHGWGTSLEFVYIDKNNRAREIIIEDW